MPVRGSVWVCRCQAGLALESECTHTTASCNTINFGTGGGGKGRGARAADYLRLLREAIRTQGSSSWDSSPNLSQVGGIQD